MYEQIARNRRRAAIYVGAFFTIWVGIGAALAFVLGSASPRATTAHTVHDVIVGAVVAGLFALVGIAISLTRGVRLVLSVSGARPADRTRYPELVDLVEALAIGDGIPTPQVYVIDDPSPNAFATGTGPRHAAVITTTGLLALMEHEELEGVIGHEMSHIKNYDVRLLLIVSTLIGMAGLLASLLWRSSLFLRPRGRSSGQLVILVLGASVLLGAVAVVFGPLIRLALSRQREELADVSGVELTRNPLGLISALRKLEQNDQPFATLNHATAAMCIDDPLQRHEKWLHRLFDTHPPIAERIAILERVSESARV